MENKRKYNIIIGSKSFFESELFEEDNIENAENFLELVQISDFTKKNKMQLDFQTDLLIVKNHNYHGIVESAHDRLGDLIEELTTEDAIIYLHNPPRLLQEYIEDLNMRDAIEVNVTCQSYEMVKDPTTFVSNMENIKSNIIGQESAIREITKSLWYLTNVNRKKPYVVMLYGNSSLGKTELVREIAENFFKNQYIEKHLSMFKNNNYSDYFFGEAPNRRSLAFDLLERESNLLFLDEIDKCPEYFYSAFYTLFDNVQFKDANYDVDISGLVIMLTSNYQNREEMQEYLGLPIYYRIDKFIHFNDFQVDTIYSIATKEIEARRNEYSDLLTFDEVYAYVSSIISASNENARTIKYKVQHVIEELLFAKIFKNKT